MVEEKVGKGKQKTEISCPTAVANYTIWEE
jgi:hypothetical protein